MVPGKAFLSINLDPEKAARLPQPDLVVLSKTDLFDAGGGVQRLLGAGAYRKKYSFPAFTLWEK
jgi:predicted xylose isomerase-like sugar epimerase